MTVFETIILDLFVGLIPATIARDKGRSFGLWWLYGAIVFIIALPHALIIRKEEKEDEEEEWERLKQSLKRKRRSLP